MYQSRIISKQSLKALKQRGNNPSSACKANYNENGKKRVINLYIQKEVV